MLADRDALRQDLSRMRESLSGILRIGAIPMFGTPEGMRVVRIEDPRLVPQIGPVVGDREPVSLPARAMFGLTPGLDVRGELDRVLHEHLDRTDV
ncbi:hypothetical protein [Lentzea sp. NBRC 102530]|uniref:hypothetical protein n=1 Tax=Lentzea sp. NBRC 102530 TaxID=3032201 RepID=UPI0024A5AAD1|nr:hypothetical protein [Lentzea sp. NBRC 102530]GLY46982.1 hypothetical protein Lesp01_06380 [Lentzea sp. NBRC 102530]